MNFYGIDGNVAVVCAVAAFKVNQYRLSTKRLLMIFSWKSDTAAIAQLPPVGGRFTVDCDIDLPLYLLDPY